VTDEADLPEAKVVGDVPDLSAALPDDGTAPPERASATEIDAPLTFPDDGSFAKGVRNFDNLVGKVEQWGLVALLALICVGGAVNALTDRFLHMRVPHKTEITHYGTFAIALFAGVYASHQGKHLSMDLLSRRFAPRARLVLKIVLSLFVAFVLVLLMRAGYHNVLNERIQQESSEKLVSSVTIAWLIPAAGALMMLHTILHMLIDFDYLRRGKTPPERMRSGH
jgi:TRAP-type C4-dicarboxylate transport system permease small subunit